MVEHTSKELPVALGVYVTLNEAGRYTLRAADFSQPTLLFDPFYVRSARELGTHSYDGIRNKLVKEADLRHLDGVASLLGGQQEVFSILSTQLAQYAAENNLPTQFVIRFFERISAQYKKIAFAEQAVRLEQLKNATGAQLDLLEALKNPDDVKFGQIFVAYKNLHKTTRDFAAATSRASELYDANVLKLYGIRPTDLVKFGAEPEIVLPTGGSRSTVNELELACAQIARDPVFRASVRRGLTETMDELRTAAEIVKSLSGK